MASLCGLFTRLCVILREVAESKNQLTQRREKREEKCAPPLKAFPLEGKEQSAV
jgi:hypothetical protein